MSYTEDFSIIVNRSDIEVDADSGAADAASGGGSGSGGFSPDMSVAEQVSKIQITERTIASKSF